MVAGVLLAMLPLTAAAKPLNLNAATGTGVRASSCGDPSCSAKFAFKAYSNPDDSNDTGTVKIQFPNFATFSGVVQCLRIDGRDATIAGVITAGNGFETDPGTPFLFVVRDLGSPYHRISPDQMSYVVWGSDFGGYTVQEGCDNPALVHATDAFFPLDSGDTVVHEVEI
jgi:hypothetical protein